MRSMETLIDEYSAKRREGMGISAIRKELQLEGQDDSRISELIRYLDKTEFHSQNRKIQNQYRNNVMLIGLLIFILGVGATLYSFFADHMGSDRIIFFGAIAGGAFTMFSARKKRFRST